MTDHHKPDSAWNLEFEDDETWANGLAGTPQQHTIGGSASYTLVFRSREYENKDPPLPHDHQDRYSTIIERCVYAGKYALNTDPSTGEVLFREQHGGQSLLVHLYPEYETPAPLGVWGLISGYTDNTSLPNTACEIELGIDILAPSAEYENHDAIRRDLVMRGL